MNSTDKHSNDITIVIVSGRDQKPFTFSKTTKISNVIDQAVIAFGLVKPGEKFELFLPPDLKTPLLPERTLESYHMADGTKLILTAMGGGV